MKNSGQKSRKLEKRMHFVSQSMVKLEKGLLRLVKFRFCMEKLGCSLFGHLFLSSSSTTMDDEAWDVESLGAFNVLPSEVVITIVCQSRLIDVLQLCKVSRNMRAHATHSNSNLVCYILLSLLQQRKDLST